MNLIKRYLIAFYNKIIQLKEKDIVLKTIPIGTFTIDTEEIASYAGGFVINYKNHHILITAAHVINKPRKLGIMLEAYQGKPNVAFYKPLPIMGLKMRTDLPPASEMKQVNDLNELFDSQTIKYDMVYTAISKDLKILQNDINSPFFNEPRRVAKINFPITVNKNDKYKIYGLNYIPNDDKLPIFNQIYKNDLRLVDEDNHYLYFKTKRKFKNTIYGCSGSPIFDKNGNIISMIVAQKDNYIQGLKLNILYAILFATYYDEV